MIDADLAQLAIYACELIYLNFNLSSTYSLRPAKSVHFDFFQSIYLEFD
jgi:hypothetical protein